VKSWVEISEPRLTENYRVLTRAAGLQVSVLAVVKADAYGHGAELCAPILANAGAAWLGVTDSDEGAAVRAALTAAGVPPTRQPRVLVMSGSLADEVDAIVEHALTPVVWCVEQLESLANAARQISAEHLPVHVEIETGMARQGVASGAGLDAVLRWFTAQKTLQLDGVMTHFASAEVAGSHQTQEQQHKFEQSMAQVSASGLRPAWVHAGNSSTVDNLAAVDGKAANPLAWLTHIAANAGAQAMVRSGLGLYGYCLPVERADEPPETETSASQVRSLLQTVMTWKSRVIGVREVQPGTTVGYNGTFVADRPMRLALLPIGYADGLRRELSSTNRREGGWAMVHGQCAPIIGRVSMNLTVVDVTAISGVAVGDEAVVLGDGITADDHARIAETIPYEVLCGVRATRRLSA
jgi:alanine racemase